MTMCEDISSPELQFILCCCKEMANPHSDERFDHDLIKIIDKNELLRLVKRHQIAPIVFKLLSNSNEELITEIRNDLKEVVLAVQLKSLSTKAFLHQLTCKIKAKGIELYLLKGLSLAEKYYGDIALRDAMDVDLLVEFQNLDVAIDIIQDMGYVVSGGYSSFSKRQKDYVKYIDYHFSFSNIKGRQPQYVELHWALRNRFGNFILNPFLNKRDNQLDSTICVGNLRGLSDIDNFLFLCSHGSEHAFFRLKWLLDIYMAYNKLNIEFNELSKRAIELKCVEQLLLSFCMMEKFLSVSIPLPVHELSKKYKVSKWLMHYCTHQILYPGQYCDTVIEKIRNLKFVYYMNRRGLFNTRLFMRYMTSPNDWKVLSLQDSLFFLYYPLRPFLILYRRMFHSNIAP